VVIGRSGTDSYKWDLRPTNRAGEKVLPMWVADMDFAVAPPITEALTRRIAHPVYGYTYLSGRYREAFVHWQDDRYSWKPNTRDLVFVPSVMPAVRTAIVEFTDPGDEVILQTPVYFPFFGAIRDNGRVVLENPLRYEDGRYALDLDQLEAIISPRTRMLILCSPHNPVGRVWTRDELTSLVDLCARRGVLILSDEIHADLTRFDHPFVPLGTVTDEAIICQSPTKTFNISGLASAFAVIARDDLRRRFSRAADRLGHELPNILSLEAGRAGYEEGGEWVADLTAYLDDQIAWFAKELKARFPDVRCPGIEGTYLAWLDFSECRITEAVSDLHSLILEKGALLLSDGVPFGGTSRHLRMNLACPRSLLEDGLNRLERVLEVAR